MRQLLVNCQVITCDGSDPIQNTAVLVNGNIIEAVGRRESLAPLERDIAPENIRDMGGRWVMPGLMDMHVHLSLSLPGPAALEAELESDMTLTVRAYRNALDSLEAGVTFIRTVGDARHVDLELKKAFNKGILKGPRLFCAGRGVIITGGHGAGRGMMLETDGADGFRSAVRAQLRAGADHIKLCITGGIAGEHEAIRDTQATFEEIQAAAEAAHNAGKKITAHAGSPTAIYNGIRAGLDCIEHGYFLDDNAIDIMLKHGTYLVPTLCVSRAEEYMRERNIPQWMIDKSLKAGEEHRKAYEKALASGVKIAMGTDMLPGETNKGTLAIFKEIEFMVEYGMTPHQALIASTRTGAELCEINEKFGTVATGKFADLIAMPDNPLDDISNLRRLDFVMKDGLVMRDFAGKGV